MSMDERGRSTARPRAVAGRGVAVAGALALSLGLAGCSGQSTQYGQLAQASGSAASAAQSAAYTLTLHRLGEVTGPVVDTGLTDSMTSLQQAGDALTGLTLTGGPRKARDGLLKQVRAAQDAVLLAQSTLERHSDNPVTKARQTLEHTAQVLSQRETDLKASK
jgi:hypothetical protein